MNHIKAILGIFLMASALSAAAQTQEKPAMAELIAAGGGALPPAAPAVPGRVVAAQRHEGKIILCTMNLEYREHIKNLVVFRVYKKIRGTATVLCQGHQPIDLELWGEGPSVGWSLPNRGPFNAKHRVVAGNVQVRLPVSFTPKHLEGTYYHVGAEVLGLGASVSPWINSNQSLNATICFPKDPNISLAFNINQVKMRLKKPKPKT